jgi:hypothetical protein
MKGENDNLQAALFMGEGLIKKGDDFSGER